MSVDPRELIVQALIAVERGEHANEVLAGLLAASQLDPRDRRFVSALFYGTLRWQLKIDRDLDTVLATPRAKLSPVVRNVLRLGLFQMDYAYSAPLEVAVNTAGDLVRARGEKSATGLVNAVLRRLGQSRQRLLKREESQAYGQSSELFGLLKSAYGPEIARELARVFLLERQELGVRPNTVKIQRDALMQVLRDEGFSPEPGHYLDSAISLVTEGVDPAMSQSFQAGLWTIQDEAAQLIAHLMDPTPGSKILDACAAPGGKTGDLFARGLGQIYLLAADAKAQRLSRVIDLIERLGYPRSSGPSEWGIEVVQRDARELPAPTELAAFDQVLIDAPCSASGLMGKQPDLRLQLTYERVQELVVIQSEILAVQAAAVKVGGFLNYATCSILPQENSLQIERFLDSSRGRNFCRVDLSSQLPLRLVDKNASERCGEVLLRPDLTPDIDGFFMARLQRME